MNNAAIAIFSLLGIYGLIKLVKSQPNPSGLNHSLAHLDEVKNKIPYMSITDQAKYADNVCMSNIHEDWLEQKILDDVNSNQYHLWNTTSVGNMAYIALHHKKQNVKNIATKALEKYKAWHNGNTN